MEGEERGTEGGRTDDSVPLIDGERKLESLRAAV